MAANPASCPGGVDATCTDYNHDTTVCEDNLCTWADPTEPGQSGGTCSDPGGGGGGGGGDNGGGGGDVIIRGAFKALDPDNKPYVLSFEMSLDSSLSGVWNSKVICPAESTVQAFTGANISNTSRDMSTYEITGFKKASGFGVDIEGGSRTNDNPGGIITGMKYGDPNLVAGPAKLPTVDFQQLDKSQTDADIQLNCD